MYHTLASPKTPNSFATNANVNTIFFTFQLAETCEVTLTMSLSDKLSIALLSCSILIVLDYITEASCIIVTYDSDKCYVYAISATNRLVIALSLNLIFFYIHDLLTLCVRIYLSAFIITYVLSALHTNSWDLIICLAIIVCFFCLQDYLIPRNWVRWIIVNISLYLVVQIYGNFFSKPRI